jgi:hypothetical protein
MKRSFVRICVGVVCVAAVTLGARLAADSPNGDFGKFVADQLRSHSEQLFGFHHPLDDSAIGPFDGSSVDALELADGLKATLISSAVENAAIRSRCGPMTRIRRICSSATKRLRSQLQRIDLSKLTSANATTIVTGLNSCDPVRRTPWGTIIVAEAGTTSVHEILDRFHIAPINVSNRDLGTTSDPCIW